MFVLKDDVKEPDTEFWLEIDSNNVVELRARKIGFATKTILCVKESGVVFCNDAGGVGVAIDPERSSRARILCEKGFPESS